MSTTTFTVPPPEEAEEQPAAPAISWHGVRTIAVLELRQRVRSTRWKVALVAWFALVGLVTVLLSGVVSQVGDASAWVFGLILLFVLGLGLLVAPTLSSTAINGDRNAGTLAILQVTMLSPADIAVGKLLAGWAAALAFLVASLPFLLWGALMGGTDVAGFVRSVVVLALLLGVVCAIGLGFSALTARTAGSSVLTYVAVASLTVISAILFGLSIPAVTSAPQPVRVYGVAPGDWNGMDYPSCEWYEEQRVLVHTERTWWLLAINPFVVLADAGPRTPVADSADIRGPLDALRFGLQIAREGAQTELDECWTNNRGADAPEPVTPSQAPVWPWGLGANLLLGGLGLATAIRRLRVPYGTLPRGTRVA